MSKISRLLWPEGPTRSAMRMADYVQIGGPARTETGSAAERLAGQVQAVVDILSTALLTAGDQLIELAAAATAATTDTRGSATRSAAWRGMKGSRPWWV